MKSNLANPTTGCQKKFETVDYQKLANTYVSKTSETRMHNGTTALALAVICSFGVPYHTSKITAAFESNGVVVPSSVAFSAVFSAFMALTFVLGAVASKEIVSNYRMKFYGDSDAEATSFVFNGCGPWAVMNCVVCWCGVYWYTGIIIHSPFPIFGALPIIDDTLYVLFHIAVLAAWLSLGISSLTTFISLIRETTQDNINLRIQSTDSASQSDHVHRLV